MKELYNDSVVKVEENGCGEIFVSLVSKPGTRIRVTPRINRLEITAHDGVFTPWSINGLPAFVVNERKA